MTYKRVVWMLPVLRDAGVEVATVSGWEGRGRPASTGNFAPFAVGNHHTGTKTPGAHPTLGMVARGRSDLPGPLCQILLARDGVAWLIAAGRANHAGVSNGAGALAAGDGNAQLIGIEVEASGKGQMTDEQRHVLPIINAALLRKMGRDETCAFLHKTWSVTGKWDLADGGQTIGLDKLRAQVKEAFSRLEPPQPKRMSTPLPVVDLSRAVHAFRVEGKQAQTANSRPLYPKGVTLVEAELAAAGHLEPHLVDGYAGPPTVRAYADWQRHLGYRDADADGIPGTASLVRLGIRKKDSFKVIA